MAKMPRRKARYIVTVRKGGFDVNRPLVAQALRERGYSVGQEVAIEIYKARNPKFLAKAHSLATLLSENKDAFAGMSAHRVLKRLQVEGNIGCEPVGLIIPGIGPCIQNIPLSLSFEQMDEGEFTEVYGAFCRHIAAQYWTDMTPEQIEQMAGFMPDTP